jgi:uncharacterized protein YaaN involved in tellurite resistance
MSSLDLGGPPEPLVLTPPAQVSQVTLEQAADAVVVPAPKQTELQQRAAGFADELAALDPRSPEFSAKVTSITTMGDRDMQAAATAANRMLQRPAAALGKGSGDAQTRVAGTLADLRVTVTDLDPKRADLTGVKKALKWLPGGDKVDRYFNRYRSAQNHLDAIIRALASGQDELRKDNAAIETEKANLWASMNRLSEYNELAAALDEALVAKVAALEAAGRSEDAGALNSDAVFGIRQRRQDIMTQMAVSVQGYLALDLIRKNNVELIKGVDRSQTTTIAALRIAVIVSQALSRQKLVLDQINALNTVTSNLIEATSQQLRTQGTAINQQAAAATVDVEKLQAAFDNVFATMDAIDTFRAQALTSMEQTVHALEGQVQRAQPYLERARKSEGS